MVRAMALLLRLLVAISMVAASEALAAPMSVGAAAPRSSAVLCNGEILFDCIANPDAAGRSLEQITNDKSYKPYTGGAPANVACALVKLGRKAAYAGAIGDDEDGSNLLQVLQEHKVNTQLVQRIPKSKTRRCMVTRDKQGDRTFAGFSDGLPSSSFADCKHDFLPQERSADAELLAEIEPVAWLVQGTLGMATPLSAATKQQLQAAVQQQKGVSLVDINWRPVFWPDCSEADARATILRFAQAADLIKITDEEADWLCGVDAATALKQPQTVRKHFPRSKAVLVTAGPKGAAWDVLGYTGCVKPCDVEVQETTGAGDAFTAGFVHSMLDFNFGLKLEREGKLSTDEQARVKRAVQFASAVGALTCTADGAIDAQPTLQQVETFLKTQYK
jgi:fructokinase